ncbi:histidine phosphatase family protein [Paenibacillus selenitireducens]|uniref:Histidine phosphatase family protein n=1 Tax=Paenibacillus selenitireducens TaxID=1324314 RepID=A0A1T2XNQ4_9BACL|nr:histidine phosphatase family protein [Paenibacillus selenitireducens]OPA81458.1 histidine phosphatase family protein [Paenibacillus selenitireducens]
MLIGLIRHGQTEWNRMGKIQGQTDIPLNEAGRSQAKLLADRLVDDSFKWDYAISSGLQRAEETAQIIANALHIPLLSPDPRLIERSYGQVEGTTQEERLERWGEHWKERDLGQETNDIVRKRAMSFLEDMSDKYPNSNLLVISHGSFLAQLYLALYQERYQEGIANLSFTVLEKKDLQWSPILYNCTRHLEGTNV